MKIAVFVLLTFVGLWVLLGAYLTNTLGISEYLPNTISHLKLPRTTTELGDSLAILDGLFSSLAIVLGLSAIILQSKELKESAKAQTDQANTLASQMRLQRESNKLSAYTARLQFLMGEMERLGKDIERLMHSTQNSSGKPTDSKTKKILNNTVEKRKRYKEDADKIDHILASKLSLLG